MAGKRQVDGARVGMQHNFGIGGAAVVTLYKKYEIPSHHHSCAAGPIAKL